MVVVLRMLLKLMLLLALVVATMLCSQSRAEEITEYNLAVREKPYEKRLPIEFTETLSLSYTQETLPDTAAEEQVAVLLPPLVVETLPTSSLLPQLSYTPYITSGNEMHWLQRWLKYKAFKRMAAGLGS